MTTSICVSSTQGQDCLIFTPHPAKRVKTWQLVAVESSSKLPQRPAQPSPGRFNQDPFYVSQTSHSILF